jgi:hypothetical protein
LIETIEALFASIKIWQTLHSALILVMRHAAIQSAMERECLGRKDTGKAAAKRRCAYTTATITARMIREFVPMVVGRNCKLNKPWIS